jgi:uncharacterized membrane protein HdeD (DUF308 family)
MLGQSKLMNTSDTNDPSGRAQTVIFLLLLIRGTLVIVLGLVLVFNPDKSRDLLFNFMGVFWLTTGIALLRQGVDNEVGSRLFRVIGLGAILTGIFVLARDIARDWLAEVVVMELLGAVILLTGALHVLSEFRVGRWAKRGKTWAHFF